MLDPVATEGIATWLWHPLLGAVVEVVEAVDQHTFVRQRAIRGPSTKWRAMKASDDASGEALAWLWWEQGRRCVRLDMSMHVLCRWRG